MLLSPTGDALRERHVVVSIDDEPCVLAALRRLLRNEPDEFLELMRRVVESWYPEKFSPIT
jgi:hypothetical protein